MNRQVIILTRRAKMDKQKIKYHTTKPTPEQEIAFQELMAWQEKMRLTGGLIVDEREDYGNPEVLWSQTEISQN
jgi:hypothetical protein